MSLIQIPKGPKYVGETGHPVAGFDMGRKEIYLRDTGWAKKKRAKLKI